MNGNRTKRSPKKLRTDEQSPIYGSFRVRSDSQSRCGRRDRSETPETASQHASRRHWDDNDDDPGPTVA